MESQIRIGNQTAFSASDPIGPLEFALTHGFRAFEWFSDKKISADGTPSGWDETDMDAEERSRIRQIGQVHDILYTVHAPWEANPLEPQGEALLQRSVDFARDIGADLVNLHLYMDQGPRAYVAALTPLIGYAAAAGVRLSIENTPLTGPEDFKRTFATLGDMGGKASHVGMCLDMGHANLYSGTLNDYVRYIDELTLEVPIIHLHAHENWGDRDSHLCLFTGPAGDNDAGVRLFIERLRARRYRGAMILEQWPQPPDLLLTAAERLHQMLRATRPPGQKRHGPRKRDTAPSGEEPGPPAQPLSVPVPGEADMEGFAGRISRSHEQNQSWRQRLAWIQGEVCSPDFTGDPADLAALAVYLRFLGTGEVACAEDGRHFRPHHHAAAALAIEACLERVTPPEHRWILRKIHPWLPSYDQAYQRSEPLTRIRDIAHRNDIPQVLKREIKHRLQNKLHRCAGPEDLATANELLERVTAAGAEYSPSFIAEYRAFHRELSEFFNATGLEERLRDLLPSLSPGDEKLVDGFLRLKAEPTPQDTALLRLLRQLTVLRERFSERIAAAETEPALRQKLRLADIGLEDYAFVRLSEAANRVDTPVGRAAWGNLLHTLTAAVANVRLSDIEADECACILAELDRWTPGFDPGNRFHLLRLKATLERAQRLAEAYSDRVLDLFPPGVATLGRAMGVAKHAIRVFCEGDIRGNNVFQVAKLVETAQQDIRRLLHLPPWAAVVPGEAQGDLVRCENLEELDLRERPVILLLAAAEGDEEIPANVRGILLGHPIPHLSHLGVRARQAGVPFATDEGRGQLAELAALIGRSCHLKITAENLSLEAGGIPKSQTRHRGEKQGIRIPGVRLAADSRPLPLSSATRELCGSKAANAARLLDLARRSAGLFRAPRGLALPFGAMEHALKRSPRLQEQYLGLQRRLSGAGLDTRRGILEALRDLVLSLPVAAGIEGEILRAFGPDARLVVRSSANGEDLEQLASAGLYESLVGVSPTDSAEAIRQVWASLWTRCATLSRAEHGIPHGAIHMAVLIQELVEPEISFIMHTADPITGERQRSWIELALGLGETLASAAQPGNAYRLVSDQRTGEASLTACASYSMALRAGARGAAVRERVDYSQVPLSSAPAEAVNLGRRLGAIGEHLESAFGAPQDVEGVIADGKIYIVQTRPQQGTARVPAH